MSLTYGSDTTSQRDAVSCYSNDGTLPQAYLKRPCIGARSFSIEGDEYSVVLETRQDHLDIGCTQLPAVSSGGVEDLAVAPSKSFAATREYYRVLPATCYRKSIVIPSSNYASSSRSKTSPTAGLARIVHQRRCHRKKNREPGENRAKESGWNSLLVLRTEKKAIMRKQLLIAPKKTKLSSENRTVQPGTVASSPFFGIRVVVGKKKSARADESSDRLDVVSMRNIKYYPNH